MNAVEHYREAEGLLATATTMSIDDPARAQVTHEAAVHADLAKVGAILLAEAPHGNAERHALMDAVT